jgi:hypothetical protein
LLDREHTFGVAISPAGPASSLLVRLYEDNTSACRLGEWRQPIQAASDMGRFHESGHTLSGKLNLAQQAPPTSLAIMHDTGFGYRRAILIHGLATAWHWPT